MGCQQSSPAESDAANNEGPGFSEINVEPQQQQKQSGNLKGGGRYANASSSGSVSAPVGNLAAVHCDIVFSVCSGGWSRAGQPSFFSGSEDKAWAHFTHSPSPRCIQTMPKSHDRCITDMTYAQHAHMLYTASRDKTIRSWSVAPDLELQDADLEGAPLALRHTFSGHTLPVSAVVVSPLAPQSQLVTGARDYHLRLWDTETAQCVFFTSIHQNVITDLAWIREEEAVLQASEDLSLRVWDLKSRAVAQVFDDGPYFALHCDVSACGNYFLTGHNGFDNLGCELKLFDRRTGKKLLSMPAAGQAVTDACFVQVEAQPGSEGAAIPLYAATSSKDGSLKVWDINALLTAGDVAGRADAGLLASEQLDLSEHVQSACSAIPPPSGGKRAAQPGHATIATGHINGRVSVWDVDVSKKSIRALMQSQGEAN
jgi:WD40 repeat protein